MLAKLGTLEVLGMFSLQPQPRRGVYMGHCSLPAHADPHFSTCLPAQSKRDRGRGVVQLHPSPHPFSKVLMHAEKKTL